MNYYEILEVSQNASKEVIKNAYRALIKKYHPDSYTGDKEYAQEILKKINEAYEVLIDDNKRLLYDYDNGFKIDPNAPKDIEPVVETEKVEEQEDIEENKFEKLKKKILEHKTASIAVSVIILFVVAFIFGSSFAGPKENEKDKDSTVKTNIENKKDESNNTNNNYNENNSTVNNRYNNTVENLPSDKEEETTKPEQEKNNEVENNNNEETTGGVS